MSNKLGWIGLGRMGEAMVKRLMAGGHKVDVWNRTASKAAPLVAYGATIAASKTDLAGCDIVFTMVSTTDDLKQVLFDDDGLVAGSQKPKVVVDSSSISQEGSAEIRERLEAMGVAYLCTPVSGNAKVAKAGKLLMVSSGPKALYTQAEPYLQAMARKVMWVGEGELARIWKIAHNTMFGVASGANTAGPLTNSTTFCSNPSPKQDKLCWATPANTVRSPINRLYFTQCLLI